MKEKIVKIKTVRPTVAGGKVVDKGVVLTMFESEAKIFLRSGKAVVAGVKTKDDDEGGK